MRLVRYIKRDPRKIQEKITYLLSNSGFQASVRSLRKRWKLSSRDNIEKKKTAIAKLLWDQRFEHDVNELMKKNDLDSSWEDWIYRHVIFNDIGPAFDPEAGIIEQDGNQFWIRIDESTNLDDVKKAYKFIALEQGKTAKRRRFKKNLQRDNEIYALAANGKTIQEIYRSMKKMGRDLDFGNIKTVVSRYRKVSRNNRTKVLRMGKVTSRPTLS